MVEQHSSKVLILVRIQKRMFILFINLSAHNRNRLVFFFKKKGGKVLRKKNKILIKRIKLSPG